MTQPKTLDEIRDWFVRRQGWRQAFRHRHASGVEQWWWERDNGDESQEHPIPPTLDAIAGLMPSGWIVTIEQLDAKFWRSSAVRYSPHIRVEDASATTEIECRATLAYLAQIEQDKHKENA